MPRKNQTKKSTVKTLEVATQKSQTTQDQEKSNRYKPPEWCTKDKVTDFKDNIRTLKERTNVLEEIEKSACCREVQKRDINAFVYKCIAVMYGTVKQRYVPPAMFIKFHTPADEVETNISFAGNISLKDYQNYRQKYKEVIPRECYVYMLDKNPVFDWSFMGIVEAQKMYAWRASQGKTDLSDSRFMKYGSDFVDKYIQKRNDVEKYAREMEIKNKGKFILVNDISFDFLFHKSNFFDLLFPLLSATFAQHKEKAYVKYFDNIFKSDLDFDPELPQREEFNEIRSQLKLNDKWIIVDDVVELNQQVSVQLLLEKY